VATVWAAREVFARLPDGNVADLFEPFAQRGENPMHGGTKVC
jgi:hypothetical protein